MKYNFDSSKYMVDLTITENNEEDTKMYFDFPRIVIKIPFNIDKDYLTYKLNVLAVEVIYDDYFSETYSGDWTELIGSHLEEINALSKILYREVCKYIYNYSLIKVGEYFGV